MPGNNASVIKRCMELRHSRWEETQCYDKLFNFRWQQLSRGLIFDQINHLGTRQVVNHLENHFLISTKHHLYENVALYCENRRQNVFDILPLTFVLQVDDCNCPVEFDKFLTFFGHLKKFVSS